MGDENIYPVPKIELFLADLVEVAQAPELAEVGLEGMREDLVLREEAFPRWLQHGHHAAAASRGPRRLRDCSCTAVG